jgi:uncharacterized protein YuzE
MIKTTFDPEADILHVMFEAPGAVYDASQEISPGVNFSFDTQGRLMGIEIEAVSLRIAGKLPGDVSAESAAAE